MRPSQKAWTLWMGATVALAIVVSWVAIGLAGWQGAALVFIAGYLWREREAQVLRWLDRWARG
jgi:O-antigen/teichoic acid export membrane protein